MHPSLRNRLIVIAFFSVFSVPWACAQEKDEAPKKAGAGGDSGSRAMLRALEEPVNTQGFDQANLLSHGLELLRDKLAAKGHDVPFHLNENRFKEEEPDVAAVGEMPLRLMNLPATLRAGSLLDLMLQQVQTRNAAYLVLRDRVEITTQRRAAPAALLHELVKGAFDKRPLAAVLDELSGQTGATILIDPRLGDKAQTPISVVLRRSIALEGAVRLLAEMSDLQAVVENDVLFLTSRARNEPGKKGAKLEFKNRRLDEALRELAEATDTTITLDPKILKELREADGPNGLRRPQGMDEGEPRSFRVMATLRGDLKPLAAVRLLTAMCELQVAVLDNVYYVTTAEGLAWLQQSELIKAQTLK